MLSKYLLKLPPTTESQLAHLTLQRSTLEILRVSLSFMQPARVVYISTYIVYIRTDNAQVYIAACLPTTLAVVVLLYLQMRGVQVLQL